MKKHTRMLTDIAVAAAVMLVVAVALLPAAAQESVSEAANESQSSSEEPKDSVTSSTTTTTSKPEEIAQTSETTTAGSSPDNTTTTTPLTIQTTEAPKPSWTEQPASGVMYVNTDGIYSLEVAQIGSKKMKQYSLNDAVTVVAYTNTNYYKLEGGTFIHSDFLSTSEIVITAGDESEPPASESEEPQETEEAEQTEETEDSEEVSDSDDSRQT